MLPSKRCSGWWMSAWLTHRIVQARKIGSPRLAGTSWPRWLGDGRNTTAMSATNPAPTASRRGHESGGVVGPATGGRVSSPDRERRDTALPDGRHALLQRGADAQAGGRARPGLTLHSRAG